MATRKSTKDVNELTKSTIKAPTEDAKARRVRTAKKAKAVADSAEMTIEKVTQSLTKAGLDINKTLNNVKELFETQVSALDTVKEAIEAKKEELEELFDKELIAQSLLDLSLKYEAEKANMKEEQERAIEEFEKEINDKKYKFEEENAFLIKSRKQDIEDYEYKKVIERRNADDEWNLYLANRSRQQSETEMLLKKKWQEKEEELEKKEKEINSQKDKIDNFDDILQKQLSKDIAIVSNKIKSDYENKAKITQLQYESQIQLLQKDCDSLREQNNNKNNEIAQLMDMVSKLQQEVKEISVAAMEAQSGRKALDEINKFAQNSTQSKK